MQAIKPLDAERFDLVLWRHAHAVDALPGQADVERLLSPRGHKQAQRMGAWLDRQLPQSTRVWASPAQRTLQTAQALGRNFKTHTSLLPEAQPQAVLDVLGWPQARGTVLVVGHQPTLGQMVATLLGLQAGDCSVKKGAVWWLQSRWRDGAWVTVVRTVQSPELR